MTSVVATPQPQFDDRGAAEPGGGAASSTLEVDGGRSPRQPSQPEASEGLWVKLLESVRPSLTPKAYAMWFSRLRELGATNDALTLAAPDVFVYNWITEHYIERLRQELTRQAGRAMDLRLVVDEATPRSSPSHDAAPLLHDGESAYAEPISGGSTRSAFALPGLNTRYTFATFVSGPSNQFAYAAAQAVAERPASAYNPLFLYGGVGLGKTHLLHAVGNAILKRNPQTRVAYLSAETFTNEVIEGINHARMEELRQKYRRGCDLMLMDDIQFLAGKDRTQEEFFHTFNTLHEAHKQLILTSDGSPKDIPGLEERVRSRFEWGLVADLQPPELETRVAIVRRKAEYDKIQLPDDVAMFLGANITSNVRELEGTFIRLAAHSSLFKKPITLDLAREVLKDIVASKGQAITCDTIVRTVATHFNVKPQEIRSTGRQRTIALPRQVAAYLCRKHTTSSFPQIGTALGGKDHSTIMSACKKIDRLLTEDADLYQAVQEIERTLQKIR